MNAVFTEVVKIVLWLAVNTAWSCEFMMIPFWLSPGGWLICKIVNGFPSWYASLEEVISNFVNDFSSWCDLSRETLASLSSETFEVCGPLIYGFLAIVIPIYGIILSYRIIRRTFEP